MAGRKQQQLIEQVEFYFSPRNLQTDTYLYGKMDSQLRVPIAVVADFPRIKEMSPSRDELVEAIGKSSLLTITDSSCSAGKLVAPRNIRPALRTTLILRDLADDIPDEEVLALFTTAPASIKREANNTRFLSFSTEEETRAMHRAVTGATLRGEPVRARIKNESMGINMLVAKHEVAEHMRDHPPPHARGYGHDEWQPYFSPFMHYEMQNADYGKGGKGGKGMMPMYGMPPGAFKGGKGGKKGSMPMDGYYYQHQHHHQHSHSHHQHIDPEKQQREGIKEMVRSAEEFPTLVPEVGKYEKEVIRWSKEEIITILQSFSKTLEISKPSVQVSLPSQAECSVILDKPDYSIELTKPVKQREQSSFLSAVKRGKRSPKEQAIPIKQKNTPEELAAMDEQRKKDEAAQKAKSDEAEAPAEAPAEAAAADTEKKMTFAEAAITAMDVRVPQVPYIQYRAGASGETIHAPGGSSQALSQKKADRGKGGKKDGSKGAKDGKARGGRGGGRGKGEGAADGRGAGKGAKGKGQPRKVVEKQAVRPAVGEDAAAAAEAAPPAPTPAPSTPPAPAKVEAGTWAAVASGLAK